MEVKGEWCKYILNSTDPSLYSSMSVLSDAILYMPATTLEGNKMKHVMPVLREENSVC